MMGSPALADMLEDFGGRDAQVAPDFGAFPLDQAMVERALPEVPVLPEIAPHEIAREELAKAEAELTARLKREHASVLAEERERHAAEMEALSARYGEILGARIMAELMAVEQNVAGIVTAVVARVLGPLMTSNLQARMVEALAGSVAEAMADAENVRVRISGSLALHEALCAAVGDKAAFFDFTESDAMDLTVRIDGKLIETRLSDWSAAMEEVL